MTVREYIKAFSLDRRQFAIFQLDDEKSYSFDGEDATRGKCLFGCNSTAEALEALFDKRVAFVDYVGGDWINEPRRHDMFILC